MRLFPCVSALVLLNIGSVFMANAQTGKTFPTGDEINLVITQTERAMQQYKPLIDQEEMQLEKIDKDSIARDREVVDALETAIKGLKGKPQAFNGPLGFNFFEWLDDATRNALLCATAASTQGALQMMAGNREKANSLLHLAQSCADVSTLIYTVSENAGALYQRYVSGEEQLAIQSVDMLGKCTDILKKQGTPAKK